MALAVTMKFCFYRWKSETTLEYFVPVGEVLGEMVPVFELAVPGFGEWGEDFLEGSDCG